MDINMRKDPKVSEAQYRERIRMKLSQHQEMMLRIDNLEKEVAELKERVVSLEQKVSKQTGMLEELANRLLDAEDKLQER